MVNILAEQSRFCTVRHHAEWDFRRPYHPCWLFPGRLSCIRIRSYPSASLWCSNRFHRGAYWAARLRSFPQRRSSRDTCFLGKWRSRSARSLASRRRDCNGSRRYGCGGDAAAISGTTPHHLPRGASRGKHATSESVHANSSQTTLNSDYFVCFWALELLDQAQHLARSLPG